MKLYTHYRSQASFRVRHAACTAIPAFTDADPSTQAATE